VLAAAELLKESAGAALLVGSTCGQPANTDVRTKSPISRASVGNCPNLGINPAMSRPSSSVGRRKWTRNAQQVRGGFAAQSAIALPRAPGRFIDARDRCRGVSVLRRVCRSRWRQLITYQRMMPHVGSRGHWLRSPTVPSQTSPFVQQLLNAVLSCGACADHPKIREKTGNSCRTTYTAATGISPAGRSAHTSAASREASC